MLQSNGIEDNVGNERTENKPPCRCLPERPTQNWMTFTVHWRSLTDLPFLTRSTTSPKSICFLLKSRLNSTRRPTWAFCHLRWTVECVFNPLPPLSDELLTVSEAPMALALPNWGDRGTEIFHLPSICWSVWVDEMFQWWPLITFVRFVFEFQL